jgi:hypothetical protein
MHSNYFYNLLHKLERKMKQNAVIIYIFYNKE